MAAVVRFVANLTLSSTHSVSLPAASHATSRALRGSTHVSSRKLEAS
jgi:hypothetical protein